MPTKKWLFVTLRNTTGYSGGMQCSMRNLNSLEDIYGKENICLYPISRHVISNKLNEYIVKIYNIIIGYVFGVNNNHLREILQIIERENITDIFLDGSIFGILAKHIKEHHKDIKITSFFHNVEYLQVKNNIRINGATIMSIPILNNIKKNEKLTCKYSDNIIVLNQRDEELIRNNYNTRVTKIIPISFKDIGSDILPNSTVSRPYNAIFIGSYFLPNIEGLIWFTEKVLPFVDIKLTVIGNGMENIVPKIDADIIKSGKINILGTVDNLSKYYENSDLVIMPLLSGGGMKVKTAEALMYGKLIIGTEEAFCGYDKDSGTVCHNEKDFISILNNLDIKNKYNLLSRDLFKKKYSYAVTLNQFMEVL